MRSTLRLISPSLELTYAAFGGRAVISTSAAGIRQLIRRRDVARATTPLFAPGMRDLLDRVVLGTLSRS